MSEPADERGRERGPDRAGPSTPGEPRTYGTIEPERNLGVLGAALLVAAAALILGWVLGRAIGLVIGFIVAIAVLSWFRTRRRDESPEAPTR